MLDSTKIYERIREALGLKTAPEIARKLSLSKQSVYDWKKGKMPGLDTLMRIAESTNTSLHWLVTGSGPKELSSQAKLRTGEARADYGDKSGSIVVYFGDAELRIIKTLAANGDRSEEAQVRELVLESLIGRLKEDK